MLESDYNGYKVRLVENLHDLKVMCSHLHPKIKVGVDTETKSLTYAPDSVAGICISCGRSYHPSEYAGYYIPLRHINYENNLPIPKVMKVVQNIVDKCVTVWWNRNFDLSMLEYDGLKVPYIGHMQDGQIMAHLAFSESYPALKDTTQKVLKFKVLEFSSNKAENNNFMTTDPRVSYIYASQDPLVTVLTSQKIWNDYPYIRKIYPLDNKALEAVRRLSATEIFLDFKFLKGILGEEQAKLRKYREECIEIAGYPFNVNSSQEKADALSRFVSLTKKTASGKWKVDDETLSTIDHPLAAALVRYSKQRTYMSSFLEKMCKFDDGEPIRVNYSSVNVQTGRLSSGGAGGNKFFRPINGQNIPKVEVKGYIHPSDEFGYVVDEDPHNCVSEDSLVSTPNGEKKISLIKEGDEVLASKGYQKVTKKWTSKKPVMRINLQDGKFIECSPEHRIKVIRNSMKLWVPAVCILPTDHIVTVDE